MFYNEQTIKTKRLTGVCKKENDFDSKIIFKNHENEGVCYIWIIGKNESMGLILLTKEKFRKQGYMSEALNEFCIAFFKDNPEYIIKNYVSLSNVESKNFHEKFGFFKSHNSQYWTMDKKRFKSTEQHRQNTFIKAQKANFFLSDVRENINFEKNFLTNFNL